MPTTRLTTIVDLESLLEVARLRAGTPRRGSVRRPPLAASPRSRERPCLAIEAIGDARSDR